MKTLRKSAFVLLLITIGLLAGLWTAGTAAAKETDIHDHWARAALQRWLDQGLLNGYGDGTVRPDEAVTRAEFVTLANKAFGFVQEADVRYADVAPQAWYARQIRIAAAAGNVRGYGDGTFRPDQPITREEAAVMLDRLLHLSELDGFGREAPFADMDSVSGWSRYAVNRVSEAGIVRGYADGTFKPRRNITRAEAVVMLGQGAGDIVLERGTYSACSVWCSRCWQPAGRWRSALHCSVNACWLS
jgi:hypothetical protein